MDIRLSNYIRENGLILDLTQGGIVECDGRYARLTGPNGNVIKEVKPIPLYINGKLFDDLSLEEFLKWEQSFHCVEGQGCFDECEGCD